MTGTEDGKRVRCGYSVADLTTGMFALIGILLALRSCDISGFGQFVDISMLDSMISAMTCNFMIYLGDGDVPDPRGTSYSTIVPYRAFATKDDDIVIAVGSEKLWRAFGPAVGHSDLVDQERPRALRKMAEVVYGDPIDYSRVSSDTRLSVSYLKDLMEGYPRRKMDQRNCELSLNKFLSPATRRRRCQGLPGV